ncbi:hypothetical protein COX21_01325 [Candidatus Falkowbacteria bacterium CG23_combo_of_CG06-09_8_20_14_all_41_10]|uniref:Outer membrane protein beta-barrel domain-containing protein n=1 Tax=Candidatus Falkowbacteria bacterium CG23_combo_of_CG06-09_8_20_14_all_41_10 TaxID=1974571 RepID=A0A2G9ZNR0_9BACT|nr:MAG: hypothetical protein COX21_01325 [Candidatus Falkowbacteria bacterium CG23_combo_of_CG06-09_8_20_14_all_41_10]
MKKISLVIFVGLLASFSYAQTEFNNFELTYKGGYSATPVEIVNDGLDTIRLGEANGLELGAGAYFNCGLGAEFNYGSSNRYFDTLAGNMKNYSFGLAFRKAMMGPGSLFDNGFNVAFKLGAGYAHSSKVDEIEYIKIINDVDTSSVWKREKTFSGFYVNGRLDIFKDSPTAIDFYGASLSGSVTCPMSSSLSTKIDDDTVKGKWDQGDMVNIVNIGLELKPVILPLNEDLGLSLILGSNYSNFTNYGYDPGFSFKAGLALDGFGKFGECARITYTRVSRENFVSNEIQFGVELIQTIRTLFVK